MVSRPRHSVNLDPQLELNELIPLRFQANELPQANSLAKLRSSGVGSR